MAFPTSSSPMTPTNHPAPITNLQDNFIHFWIHIGLVILGFLIAIISFFVQLCRPASYGKHADGSGRCPFPTKLFYVIAELIPGFIIFTITYFIMGQSFSEPVNIVMYVLFTIHYLTRGLVMPMQNLSGQLFSSISRVVSFHWRILLH